MKAIVEAGGGTTDDIIKINVWLKDRSQREPVNAGMGRDVSRREDRPARQAMHRTWMAARLSNAISSP